MGKILGASLLRGSHRTLTFSPLSRVWKEVRLRSKNGGPKIPGRKLSSFSSPSRHVIDMIDFIYELEWKDKTFLTQKYLAEGRSIAQIAAETLSSKSAIREALIEFDIKRKPQGKPGLRPSQPPYGYRLSHGLMVPHLGEQRVIASVKKMIDGGVSFRKTCEFLTSVDVPTKKKGKSWQPEMIRRLLSR